MGFEERLGLLVDTKWNRRQQNRMQRCLHNAHLAAPGAAIEDIEYHEDRRLDKAQILRFATCQYIDEGHHQRQINPKLKIGGAFQTLTLLKVCCPKDLYAKN